MIKVKRRDVEGLKTEQEGREKSSEDLWSKNPESFKLRIRSATKKESTVWHICIFTHSNLRAASTLEVGAGRCPAEGRKEEGKRRRRKKRMRTIHLLSAVVGRRNNWLLSPGKFPDQFLFMIDKNKKLFSSTEREHRRGGKKELRKQTQAQERGRWRQRAKDRGRPACRWHGRRSLFCVSVWWETINNQYLLMTVRELWIVLSQRYTVLYHLLCFPLTLDI